MLTITFLYSDGRLIEFGNLKSVQYRGSELKTISGEDLLTHFFPISTQLRVQSETESLVVSNKDLLAIRVIKA